MEEKKMQILVAVDGSDNSNRAIIKAKQYSNVFDGQITLLTVLKPLAPGYYTYMEPPIPDEKQMHGVGKSILEKSLEVLGKPKDEVITKIRIGNPADEILQEADEEEYDLIVMGSRGLGVFSRSFLGSVSNKVLNHTNTDVLIIK